MRETIVSSTGTRDGMTTSQMQVVLTELIVMHELETVVSIHNGLCEGADAQFAKMARPVFPYAEFVGHPGMNKRGESPTRDYSIDRLFDKFWPVDEYLARDRVMAQLCDVMIGTPATANEVRRSGTWATIRAARKLKRRIIWFEPDGTRHEECA